MPNLQEIDRQNAREVNRDNVATVIGNSDDSWNVDGVNAPDLTVALKRSAAAGKTHYRIAYLVNGKRQHDRITSNPYYTSSN